MESVHDRAQTLRDTSRQLRSELLKTICSTIRIVATFPNCKGGDRLEESCQRTAWKGYNLIRNLASRDGFGTGDDVAQSLESVRAVLMSPAGADEAANVSTGLCAPASTQSPPFEMGLEPLSKREIEVLKHVAEGQSTKQAAAIMGITFKTASCHRQHVMAKLGIHDTASLVRYAIRRGIAAA